MHFSTLFWFSEQLANTLILHSDENWTSIIFSWTLHKLLTVWWKFQLFFQNSPDSDSWRTLRQNKLSYHDGSCPFTVTSINNNLYTPRNPYKFLTDGLFGRQKTMDFKTCLLLLLRHLAIDRVGNGSFPISCHLNRSEVPTFSPRVGHLSKVPTFPPLQGQKFVAKSPSSLCITPHQPGVPHPLWKADDKCMTCVHSIDCRLHIMQSAGSIEIRSHLRFLLKLNFLQLTVHRMFLLIFLFIHQRNLQSL